MVSASELDLDVTACALGQKGELLSDWLSFAVQVGANALAECVKLTEIMDLKQKIRDFSYGTSSEDENLISL